jgi:hypothetical protein
MLAYVDCRHAWSHANIRHVTHNRDAVDAAAYLCDSLKD